MMAVAPEDMRLYSARRRNLRVSPQKLRLAADLIRGKDIQVAMDLLNFSVTKSARILNKVLNNAFNNAEVQNADIDKLVVQSVTVDKGIVLKRRHPSGRGRMRANYHRFSHVDLSLAEKRDKEVVKAQQRKAAAKEQKSQEEQEKGGN
jgi:large subunit ribosomal protein L22